MRLPRLFLSLLFLLPTLLLGSSFEDFPDKSPVLVELLSEDGSIQAGQPFWVGIKLNIEDHWHVYWRHPGESGMPTEVFWELPEGFTVGELLWPAPEKFESSGLTAYGYEGGAPFLLAEITPPENLEAGTDIELGAEVTWVACHTACIPGEQMMSLSMPVRGFPPLKDVANAHIFDQARIDQPRPLEVSVESKDSVLHLRWKNPESYDVKRLIRGQFFSDDDEVLALNLGLASASHEDEPGVSHLELPVLGKGSSLPDVIRGVLRLEDAAGQWTQSYEIEAPLTAYTASTVVSKDTPVLNRYPKPEPVIGFTGFLLALGGAFLGGLFLNLMPCVLPVISLKILGFVKMADKDGKGAYWYGISFAAGVLVSFWVLAGLLVILQASGAMVGWGFQLQEPAFIVAMCFVLMLVGLNFFGVFEIGTSVAAAAGSQEIKSQGLGGAFMSGVLATALATPCTGPFLGTAIGFAATLTPLASLTVFTFIGLGMSSPYLLLSAFPPLMKFLPKPGMWMIAFKQAMGFVMLATVLWLLWVFTALTYPSAIFGLLAYLLVAAFAAWVFGCWATPVQRLPTRRIATCVSLLLLGVSVLQSIRLDDGRVPVSANLAGSAKSGEGEHWQYFSEDKLTALREKGVPVLVDFTARWCLICQANKIALHDYSVTDKMDEMGVASLEADWTRRDPAITKFLRQFGRNGVPLYVLFPADSSQEPIILPQTLTPDTVLEYLAEIAK